MVAPQADRRLTAVLAADVVGFSRLMERDEDGTLARLKAHRKELANPLIAEYRGRTVKLMGDGALCEFASVVDAARCAVLIQRGMAERERGIPEPKRIRFRIGINLGDVIHEDDGDLYGDGVNVAARLEQLAEPGGVVVSGTAFDHLQGKLDLPLDFMGEQHVKNIDRLVRAYRVRLGATPFHRLPSARRLWKLAAVGLLALLCLAGGWWLWTGSTPVAQKPRIAVLPFVNLSDEASDEYLADGITGDLITDLAQLSGLVVIARNTVFSYKGRAAVVTDVGRELGVSHVVEGSVQRTGDGLRINAQLVDANAGANLWADRFDRSAGDMFAVESEVIRQIIAALAVQLSPSEQARLDRPPTSNLEAYDSFLRAERAASSGFRPELRNALALYAKATQLDPDFADAFAAHARTAAYVWANNYDDVLPAPVARREAYDMASRAVQLDPETPLPYAVLAVLQVFDRQFEEAIASARRAVALGPSDADAYAALGLVLMFAGEHAQAMQAVDEALRLDPSPAIGDRLTAGLAYSLGGNHKRAIEVLEQARATAARVDDVHLVLAVAYARAGQTDDARAAVVEVARLQPDLNFERNRISYEHFRDDRDLAAVLDAMRKAGVPQWPFGFRGDGLERLSEADISHLALGRTWQGRTEQGDPAFFQIGQDGRSAFRTPTKFETGTVFVDRDMLCDQSESALLGRPVCGPIYRQKSPTETGDAYIYVNANKLLHFSPTK